MNQFIHVETKEVVRIVSDAGNFFTLDNGMKIDKQLFSQKYAAINSDQTMDADAFLNQRPSIQVNPQKTNNQINEQAVVNTTDGPVDPIEFLNSTISSLRNIGNIENILKIDTSKYVNAPDSQRVIVRDLSTQDNAATNMQTRTIDNEKQALLEKYKNIPQPQGQFVDEDDEQAVHQLMKNLEKPKPKQQLNENGLTAAQEIVRKDQIELTGVDPFADKIRKYRSSKGLPIEPVQNPKPIEQVVMEQPQPTQVTVNDVEEQQQIVTQEDPTISIFKKFKRNHNVTVKLEIKDKISKPEFIKVMADGLEGDIIEYYTNELFKTFLNDFKGIKKEIYNQLYKDVYGYLPGQEPSEEETEKIPKERKISNVPKYEKSQLNEGLDDKNTIILIPGKPTKTGKLTFKYIDKKGKVVDMIPETAENKGYKPAKESDIK